MVRQNWLRMDALTSVMKISVSLIGAFALLAAPALDDVDSDERFLQEMIQYAEAMEQQILRDGRPLNDDEIELAKMAGIKHPEKVRFLILDSVPLPESEYLQQELDKIGFLELLKRAGGTAKGYGVLLATKDAHKLDYLVHELVHVEQYERLGGIANAYRQHWPNLRENGYRKSALEDEAYSRTEEIMAELEQN